MKPAILKVAALLILVVNSRHEIKANDVYVGTLNDIVKIDQNGNKTVFASGAPFAPSGINYPDGIANDSSGNIYVSNSDGKIFKFNSAGQWNIFAQLPSQGVLTFDHNGNLFAAIENNTIQKISPSGQVSQFASGVVIAGMAFDNAGNLYASQNNQILKFDSSGQQSVFASGFFGWGLGFDSYGNLYAANTSDVNILKFAPNGSRTVFASLVAQGLTGYGAIRGLAVDENNSVYLTTMGTLIVGGNKGRILEFNSNGVGSVFANELDTPLNLTIIPEPSTFALINLGIIGLLYRRRL